MTGTDALPPVARVEWSPCFRVVPSRYPPIQLFERVASPEDLDVVFAVEGMTNTRLRDEVGDLRLVAPEDRVTGPGAGSIMAPFTHVWAPGGRFTLGERLFFSNTFMVRIAASELVYSGRVRGRGEIERKLTIEGGLAWLFGGR